MQIISGSSNQPLAQRIAQNTGYKLLKTKIGNFSDGELKVEIQDNIGKDVIIIQSISHPVNDHLIELLLLVDTARRAGAQNIISVVPYFAYIRQDRCTYKYGPISASLVIKLLEAAGVTKVITLDLHSKQLEGVFNVPIINLDPASIFFPFYNDDVNIVVVSPDIGGIARANNFSIFLGKDLVIMNKIRDVDNECYMNKIIGNVENKKCIIIDDIVDTGGTICKAAELLRSNGALNIEAYVTHPVLSADSKEKIMNSQIDKIFVSDSIYHGSMPSKFVVTYIDELISCRL
ncbi:MAG: ribose-phosphate diphosphokinase [Rickettsiaceae bacterium]